MTDFSQQIDDFINYGTYVYKFDSAGNQILNASSSIFQQVYLSLPIKNLIYNNTKILSFYDPKFTEFVPVVNNTSNQLPATSSQEFIDKINTITYENTQLQNQLENLISLNEVDTGSADMQSVKNIIIGLRTQLGQGTVENDFQNVYPYLPVSLESKNAP